MADWTLPMMQTFEYYEVDPGTWKDIRLIDTVESCSITRDNSKNTIESASMKVSESIGEIYIRVYLVVTQNLVTEKFPLGCFLAETPSRNFNGKRNSISVDAYSALYELTENNPPLGYYIPKGSNTLEVAYQLIRDNCRAPVVKPTDSSKLYSDFVANSNDTWLTYISDLAYQEKYTVSLDEMSRIIFLPNQKFASMQPKWIYDDGNSSILQPEIDFNQDLYKIPNVVEVTYSDDTHHYYAVAKNEDPNSITSIQHRGRVITNRISNPSFSGEPTKEIIERYAQDQLESLSTVQVKLSYKHGYNGIRLGDCVRLDYSRAGLSDIKAVVTSQSIECTTGCQVSETAIFTKKFWDKG